MKSVNQHILILIPAFNEEGNLRKIIEEIFVQNLPLKILVINDGSTDRTSQEASQAGADVIALPFNLGIGAAVQTGFQFAQRYGYSYVVRVDGDGQHDPNYIDDILEPVQKNMADMVMGSRFLPPFLGYRSSWVRRCGIQFFAWLISLLASTPITDPTSGFTCYNKKMISLFAKKFPQDYPEPEAILLAKQAGGRIQEVPVQMRKRTSGVSSIRYVRTLYYLIKVTIAILLDLIKKKHCFV